MLRVVRTAFMLSAVAGTAAFTIAPAFASVTEHFMTHAHFETARVHADAEIDPEIFVADKSAPQGTGALGIMHDSGFRPARSSDNPSLPVYNAQGVGLSLNLGRWSGATGTADFTAQSRGTDSRVHCTFAGLVPFGIYSLFVGRVTHDGTTVTPLSEATNKLTASVDGFLDVSTQSTDPLETGDTLLLVYHSDGESHGVHRGELGITAHEQLLLPAVIAAQSMDHEAAATPSPSPSPTVEESAPAEPTAAPAPSVDDESTPTPTPTVTPTPDPDNSNDDVFMPTHRTTPAPVSSGAAAPVSPDDEPTF